MPDYLQPGPELDALVEKRIFGRKWVLHQYVKVNGTVHATPTWLLLGQCPSDPPWGTVPAQVPPPRSTDIGAAWEVVEAFAANGWRPWVRRADNGTWLCRMTRKLHYWNAQADTAPHAICLAALETSEKGD